MKRHPLAGILRLGAVVLPVAQKRQTTVLNVVQEAMGRHLRSVIADFVEGDYVSIILQWTPARYSVCQKT